MFAVTSDTVLFSEVRVKPDSVTQDRFCQHILSSYKSPCVSEGAAQQEGQWGGCTLGGTKQNYVYLKTSHLGKNPAPQFQYKFP